MYRFVGGHDFDTSWWKAGEDNASVLQFALHFHPL